MKCTRLRLRSERYSQPKSKTGAELLNSHLEWTLVKSELFTVVVKGTRRQKSFTPPKDPSQKAVGYKHVTS